MALSETSDKQSAGQTTTVKQATTEKKPVTVSNVGIAPSQSNITVKDSSRQS